MSLEDYLQYHGKLIESYRYTTIGEIKAYNHGTLLINPWRFSSKRLDAETGFFYFGQRYYAPDIGRWITPDPAGFKDGPNLYAYVHNQPLIKIDPDGQFAFFLVPMIISMAVDYCLPIAAAYLAETAGCAAAAAFVSGVAQGYSGSILEPSSFAGADLTTTLSNWAGKGLGTVLSFSPQKLAVNAGKTAVNVVGKECMTVASKIITNKSQQMVTFFTKKATVGAGSQAAQKTAIVAENYLGKGASQSTKQIWSETKKFSPVEKAFDHWKNHGKEFPELINAKQYVEKAQGFLNNPRVLSRVRQADSNLLRYECSSNTLVTFTKDGIPKTMFKPTLGKHKYPTNLDYFYGQ